MSAENSQPFPRTINLTEKTVEDLIAAHLYAMKELKDSQDVDIKIGTITKGKVPITIKKKREVRVILLNGESST